MGVQHNKVYGDELFKVEEALNLLLPGRIPQEESIRLKNMGFIQNKGTDKFNCNVITRSGLITAEDLEVITQIAFEYGDGKVAIMGGSTVEIIGIPYRHIAAVIECCRENGIEIGGMGAKVRPVVSCQGDMCRFGIVENAQKMAEKIQGLFYHRLQNEELPNKFEIAISFCPSDCSGANTYDVGIVGISIPRLELNHCKGCGKCSVERFCPTGAAKVADGVLKIQQKECDYCGLCVNRCPFGTVKESMKAFRVYIGGNRGKLMRKGYSFSKLIVTEEAMLSVIDRLIYIYKTEGEPGEWFSDTVDRLGAQRIEERVLAKVLQ